MTIEFHPKSLGGVIGAPNADKRFGNREGQLITRTQQGDVVRAEEGVLPKLYKQALEFDRMSPHLVTTIYSQSCSGHVFGFDLPQIGAQERS